MHVRRGQVRDTAMAAKDIIHVTPDDTLQDVRNSNVQTFSI
jgi:hypothetical protein